MAINKRNIFCYILVWKENFLEIIKMNENLFLYILRVSERPLEINRAERTERGTEQNK